MQSAMKGIACLGLLAALCSVRGAAAQEPARHAVGLELRGDTMIYRSVALSVMAEHHLDGKCLAVIFDGTGFGTDGTVWGGEFLLCEDRSFIRVGAVKPISMISGDESVRQAWKSLLCHLVHSGIPSDDKRAAVVKAAVAGGLNTVKSSSMGRLFDAVSAALGLADYNTYQGRCAMLLENQAGACRFLFPRLPR